MTQSANAQNPFAYWQDTMSHWMPTTCQQPQSAMVEPFTMVNPMAAFNPAQMTQMMQMWQSFFMPQPTAQKPQFPFPFPMPSNMMNMTTSMGDMKPMFEMMMQMQQAWMSQMMKMGSR